MKLVTIETEMIFKLHLGPLK